MQGTVENDHKAVLHNSWMKLDGKKKHNFLQSKIRFKKFIISEAHSYSAQPDCRDTLGNL